jgi:FKBP-type peptidyl-prolyl cis-trans isomerase
MKNKICMLLFFLAAVALCNAEGVAEAAQKGNEKAELSYAFGMAVALDLADTGLGFNYDSFIRGFRNVMENEKTRYTIDEAMDIIQAAFDKAQTELGEKNRAAGEAFLSENSKRPGVITTSSGLQYELISDGNGEKPSISDTVLVHYRGFTIDGNVFDSSYDDETPMEIPLDVVIHGWSEGLRMMREGEKAMLYIPSDLAYGEWGAGPAIGPNEVIVFEVELFSIIEPPAP